MNGAGEVWDESEAWRSRLRVTDREIVGHPIDPRSRVLRQQVTLPGDEWQLVLSRDDPAVEIHIAAGSPLDHQSCRDSLQRSRCFFNVHFPDRPFASYLCHSWILDAQFEQLLPQTSNLVRFQQEVYLFPIRGRSWETLNAVFGRGTTTISKVRLQTTMQRAFAGHLKSGGHFRSGGCFILADDLHRWGTRFYRNQALPWGAASSSALTTPRD